MKGQVVAFGFDRLRDAHYVLQIEPIPEVPRSGESIGHVMFQLLGSVNCG